ncbi:MAG: hypothetical protein ACJ78Q_10735 [Chloroflexia bacterium]
MVSKDTSDEAGREWQFRALKREDVGDVATLFDAADRADGLFKLSSEDDIAEAFGDIPGNSAERVLVWKGARGEAQLGWDC